MAYEIVIASKSTKQKTRLVGPLVFLLLIGLARVSVLLLSEGGDVLRRMEVAPLSWLIDPDILAWTFNIGILLALVRVLVACFLVKKITSETIPKA